MSGTQEPAEGQQKPTDGASPVPAPAEPLSPEPKVKSTKSMWWIAAVLAVLAVIAVVAVVLWMNRDSDDGSAVSGDLPVERAASICSRGHLVEDDGKSMSLDTKGTDEGTNTVHDEVGDVVCMLEQLEAPSYVTKHIETTRALDGQQSDTWEDFEARWTYHPDDGLQITFIDRS